MDALRSDRLPHFPRVRFLIGESERWAGERTVSVQVTCINTEQYSELCLAQRAHQARGHDSSPAAILLRATRSTPTNQVPPPRPTRGPRASPSPRALPPSRPFPRRPRLLRLPERRPPALRPAIPPRTASTDPTHRRVLALPTVLNTLAHTHRTQMDAGDSHICQ